MKKKNLIIQKIQENNMKDKNTQLVITFDKNEVYNRFPIKGLSDLWKKVTNGLVKYDDKDNRSWYKGLGINGYYIYTINDTEIEMKLFVDKVINHLEFIKRLNHVCPIKKYEIKKTLTDNKPNLVEMDSSLFGEYRLNQSTWN